MRKAEAVGLLDALAECAEAPDLATMREVALRRVLGLIPAEVGMWAVLDIETGAFSSEDGPGGGLGEEYWRALLEHKDESPLYDHRVSTLDFQVLKESDFISERRWRNTGIWHDVLRTR